MGRSARMIIATDVLAWSSLSYKTAAPNPKRSIAKPAETARESCTFLPRTQNGIRLDRSGEMAGFEHAPR